MDVKDSYNTNGTIISASNSHSSGNNNGWSFAGEAVYFKITGDPTMTAGGTNYITITAYDADGNIATSYTGDKSLIFSGANPSASPVTQPTASDKNSSDVGFGTSTTVTFTTGVGHSNLKLYRAETAAINTADGSISATGYTLSVAVSAAGAATFTITTQPGNTNGTVDSALQQQPKIHVLDQFGNFVSDNTTVTASLVTGTGSLRNLTSDTSSGDATFTNLGYSKSGETFSIKFSTNGHDSATSNSITALLPGLATTLTITTQPGNTNGTVDSALQQQPKIHVLDQFGNFVPIIPPLPRA